MKKENTIKIEISTMLASCLQRMIVYEIENQQIWKVSDKSFGIENDFRDEIIKEMKQLAEDLASQGIAKYENRKMENNYLINLLIKEIKNYNEEELKQEETDKETGLVCWSALAGRLAGRLRYLQIIVESYEEEQEEE